MDIFESSGDTKLGFKNPGQKEVQSKQMFWKGKLVLHFFLLAFCFVLVKQLQIPSEKENFYHSLEGKVWVDKEVQSLAPLPRAGMLE